MKNSVKTGKWVPHDILARSLRESGQSTLFREQYLMESAGKAVRIRPFDLGSPHTRTFHMTWVAFHLCFFGWFGVAPLMAVIREDLGLSQSQVGATVVASVAITIVVRLIIGPLCDRLGPRRTYAGLLILGAIPVFGVGLADSYESFLLARLAIGAIGASFVITQYHTSMMYAPNVVGTANALTAGWGNLGGGTTQIVMPLVLAALVSLGVSEFAGWRLAMTVPGVLLLATGIAYYLFTRDTPDGDFRELRARGAMPPAGATKGGFGKAARDYRVWALFIAYAACFGVELTFHNIAAIYYFDYFDLSVRNAGILAGCFGLLAAFARPLGGWLSDRAAHRVGLHGRVQLLAALLLGQGLMLMVFSQMQVLAAALATMLVFGLFVHMACGATFGLVPFVNREALGSVAGIVGAGGNAGAVAAGLLFMGEAVDYRQGLLVIGVAVVACALCTATVRFSPRTIVRERRALRRALSEYQNAPSGSETGIA